MAEGSSAVCFRASNFPVLSVTDVDVELVIAVESK